MVEALAQECGDLWRWLRRPPAGTSEAEFAAKKRAYFLLCEAVRYLPRGPAALRRCGALGRPAAKVANPEAERAAQSFTVDELALLERRTLTSDGWVIPVPLLARVEAVKAELATAGNKAGDVDALREILTRVHASTGQSLHSLHRRLPALRTRLSRLRAAAAVTRPPAKVPPPRGTQ